MALGSYDTKHYTALSKLDLALLRGDLADARLRIPGLSDENVRLRMFNLDLQERLKIAERTLERLQATMRQYDVTGSFAAPPSPEGVP